MWIKACEGECRTWIEAETLAELETRAYCAGWRRVEGRDYCLRCQRAGWARHWQELRRRNLLPLPLADELVRGQHEHD